MKSIFFILLFSLAWGEGIAQSIGVSGIFSGVQIFNKNDDLPENPSVRKPVADFCESRCIALSNRLQIGADVVFRKNTINFDFAKATLLEVLYTSMPVYLDIYLTSDFFLEGGAYAGLQANSGNVGITEFVQAAYIEDIDLNWDAGFVAGVGLDVAGLGKLRLRYNHGLLKIVPIDRQTIVRNRIVEIGVAIVL